ncbi:MAG: glycosyltransferase family 39 protein [Burkholderiales bacterium]|nr:glycosyltransferase family 39 protein [Burkholderiales bacterium]
MPPLALNAAVVALVAAIALAWFLPLGMRHLLPSDEGRYAEIAREMWASGDWVTIRYNDVKYFEKPPFQMWMTAIAYWAFGIGEWQARLWVALGGAFGLGISMLAADRWFGRRVAVFTGLILLAAPTWNIASHFNSLDMGVSAALAGVLAGFLIAQHPQASAMQQRNWMWFAWAAMAVAMLTKGLIGIVLPGLVLFVYTLIGRDWQRWRRLHAGTGLLIFLLIVEPWFYLISKRNPEFVSFFFIHEHFARYLSGVHHRGAPWWYFVPQLLVGMLPWLGLSWGMARVVREDRAESGFKPALLLGVWAAVIFVFFSVSGSKLPGYIVPVFPALAILAAVALDRLDAAQWRRQVLVAAALVVAAYLALPLLARQGGDTPLHEQFRAYAEVLAWLLALAAFGIAAAFLLGRRHLERSIAVYALSMFFLFGAALVAHETFGRERSGVALVAPIQRVLEKDMPIYSVRLLDHTLPFYLRHTTIMVEEPDELDFGVRRDPQKWIPTLEGFIAVWRDGPRALAVMSHETLAVLRERKVVMFALAADSRRVVVSNFAQAQP